MLLNGLIIFTKGVNYASNISFSFGKSEQQKISAGFSYRNQIYGQVSNGMHIGRHSTIALTANYKPFSLF